MGCESYYVDGDRDFVHFGESDDLGCLCTFPRNDDGRLNAERVRSLAYLGAAVVLIRRDGGGSTILPDDLPDWVRREIDRVVGSDE